MARHLDLRHDRHEARACVGDDLADIVLRIEATVRPPVEAPRGRVLVLSTDERLTAPPAHLGETRVLLDLEAPPLVVGQVPVEAVELTERREIDVLLHELLRHEVTGHVEVDAPPREPGRRSEEHTSELQSQSNLVCRLLLEKKKKKRIDL